MAVFRQEREKAGGVFRQGTHHDSGSEQHVLASKGGRDDRIATIKRIPQSIDGKQDWRTPVWFFNQLNEKYGPFNVDVAADATNTLCASFITAQQDALTTEWGKKNWCNPPYANIRPWLYRAYIQAFKGKTTVMLLRARTEIKAVWEFQHYAKIEFISPRIAFEDGSGKKSSPLHGSMLMIFTPKSVKYPRAAHLLEADLVEYREKRSSAKEKTKKLFDRSPAAV